MKTKLLLASTAALCLASAIAWAGVNAKQMDTGGMCWEFSSGVTQTDAWCWSPLGVFDFDPATTAADSAATNDMFELKLDTPVDTTGTNTHNALTIDIDEGNASGGTNAVRGIQIDALTGEAQNTTVGINIGAMTGTGGTENGIVIGSGWDAGISSASPMTVSGAGGLTLANSESLHADTDATFDCTRNDAGTVSITASDDDATAALTILPGGAAAMTLGGASTTAVTVTTDGTGTGEVVLPTGSVSGTEITDATILPADSLYPNRGTLTVCSDATTVNNNTVYYGQSKVHVTSATVGLARKCDTTAAGNVTEATADEPAYVATAFQVVGLDCINNDSGVTLTFTTRSAAAATTPSISASIADNILQGTGTGGPTTTAIASAATFAIAVSSGVDVTTANVPFVCTVSVAY